MAGTAAIVVASAIGLDMHENQRKAAESEKDSADAQQKQQNELKAETDARNASDQKRIDQARLRQRQRLMGTTDTQTSDFTPPPKANGGISPSNNTVPTGIQAGTKTQLGA